jgi:hypothetical protein
VIQHDVDIFRFLEKIEFGHEKAVILLITGSWIDAFGYAPSGGTERECESSKHP